MRRIELGFGCNNACLFCALGRLREEVPKIAEEVIDQQIDEVVTGDRVAFVGGEPTLFEQLAGWGTRVRERGAWSILVQTNARRLAVKGYAHSLIASGIDVLDVSLHGCNEAMHDYHTAVDGSFRQTVAGLRRARAAGLTFGITTVVTRSNYRHLSEIVHVAHTLGARAVHLPVVVPKGSGLANWPRLQVAPALLEPHISRAVARAHSLGLVVVRGENLGKAGSPQLFAGMGRAQESSGEAPAQRHLPVAR